MNMAPVGGATIRPRAPSFKEISMTYFSDINAMRVYFKNTLMPPKKTSRTTAGCADWF